MAFKIAGSIAMKQAMEQAGPVLLEPIMLVTVSVPEDSVGDVIGDLNSRRGRPLGMEPTGAGMTEVKAEVPMAEMLSYAPDLRSITGGQGEFTMEFLRYEEVPAHLAGKVVEEAQAEKEAVKAKPSEGPRSPAEASRSGASDRPVRWYARVGDDQGHPDLRRVHGLRRVRPHAAARREGRRVPERRHPPLGVRAVQGAGAARGLGARGHGARLRRQRRRL